MSAVAVLHDLSSDCFILTKRSAHLRHHPGEVCFPGGYWEETDSSLYATALRELDEELNINSSRVTLIKPLERVGTLLGTPIYPWLGKIESLTPFNMNIEEVEKVLSIPVSLVRAAENYEEVTLRKGQYEFKSVRFVAHKELIWGATAKIMLQLSLK